MPFSDIVGHEGPKALLRAALVHDRLAHAYLFYGEDSIGKRLTAVRFAQAVCCESTSLDEPDACGTCRSCYQIEAHTHPDFLLIEADQEQSNPQIKIEQIRELEQQVIYRPLIGRNKICLIDEADRMTLGAANALLKTLEEPPAHSLFILVSSRPFALPATIRSRCQQIRFVPPARTQVEAALILRREIPPEDAHLLTLVTECRIGQALNADLRTIRATQAEYRALMSPKSLRSAAGLLTAAEALARSDRAQESLEWILRWLRDLLLVKIEADPEAILNLDCLADLRDMARQIDVETLLDLITDLDTVQRAAGRNLNLQIVLETVLLRLRDAALVR